MNSELKLDSSKSNLKSCLTNANTDETVSFHFSAQNGSDQEGVSEVRKKEKDASLRNKMPKELAQLPQWNYWLTQFDERKSAKTAHDAKAPASDMVDDNTTILSTMKRSKSKTREKCFITKSNGILHISKLEGGNNSSVAPLNQNEPTFGSDGIRPLESSLPELGSTRGVGTAQERKLNSSEHNNENKRRRVSNFPPLYTRLTPVNPNSLFRIPSAKSSTFDDILCNNGYSGIPIPGGVDMSQKDKAPRPILPKPESSFLSVPCEMFGQTRGMPYFSCVPHTQFSWASPVPLYSSPFPIGNRPTGLEYPFAGSLPYSAPMVNHHPNSFMNLSVPHPSRLLHATPEFAPLKFQRISLDENVPSCSKSSMPSNCSSAPFPMDRTVPCLSQVQHRRPNQYGTSAWNLPELHPSGEVIRFYGAAPPIPRSGVKETACMDPNPRFQCDMARNELLSGKECGPKDSVDTSLRL